MLKTLTTLWFPNGSQERTNLVKLLSTSLKKPAKVLQPPISQGCKKSCLLRITKVVKIMTRMPSGFENIKDRKETLARYD